LLKTDFFKMINDDNFSIRIFNSFNDDNLKEAWIKLEIGSNAFPQMYYEWIEPWWKRKGIDNKLHIITVVNNDGIIAIAPFCIRNIFGIRLLETIPKHFGDFFDFISVNDYSSLCYRRILDYCYTFKNWNLVRLNQINSTTTLFAQLCKASNAVFIKSSDLVYTNTIYKDIDQFLNAIPKKQRNEYKRRLKRFKELGNIELKTIQTFNDYNRYESAMKNIYIKRWGTMSKKNDLVFEYRKESYGKCLDKKKALGFILTLDDVPVAYRLGFLHNDIFVSWKLVYNPEYSKFSLGNLISLMSIEYAIKFRIRAINNGVGDYAYKRDWFNNLIRDSNYSIYIRKKTSLVSLIYIFIQLKLKPLLKKMLYKVRK